MVNKNLIGLRKRELCLSGSHAYHIPADNQGKGRCQARLWTIAEFFNFIATYPIENISTSSPYKIDSTRSIG